MTERGQNLPHTFTARSPICGLETAVLNVCGHGSVSESGSLCCIQARKDKYKRSEKFSRVKRPNYLIYLVNDLKCQEHNYHLDCCSTTANHKFWCSCATCVVENALLNYPICRMLCCV